MLPSVQDLGKMRKNLGISQKEIAKMVGVSQSYIARMEKGDINPTYENVKKIYSFQVQKVHDKNCIGEPQHGINGRNWRVHGQLWKWSAHNPGDCHPFHAVRSDTPDEHLIKIAFRNCPYDKNEKAFLPDGPSLRFLRCALHAIQCVC